MLLCSDYKDDKDIQKESGMYFLQFIHFCECANQAPYNFCIKGAFWVSEDGQGVRKPS